MNILIRESLLMVLLLSGLPLLAASCSGLCISLLQTVTQVQEQTISYAVKVLTLSLVIAFCAEYGVQLLCEFSQRIFEGISQVDV